MHSRLHTLVVVTVVAVAVVGVVAAPVGGLPPATTGVATAVSADATDHSGVWGRGGSSHAVRVPAEAQSALDEHDDDGGSGAGNESVAANESARNETRAPGPRIGSADVTVLRAPGVVGEPLVVTATTTNNGTEPGRKVVQFEVGDELVENRTFVLAPGETRTETFVHTFETPGNHSFEVDAGRNRFVTIDPKRPSLSVLSVAASPATLSGGGEVAVTALVKNDGEADGTVSVPLELFGEVVTVREVALPAGETTEVTFTRRVQEPGSYEAVVGDRSASFAVSAGTSTETTDEDPVLESASETPGFGPVVAVAGGALAAALVLWRRR